MKLNATGSLILGGGCATVGNQPAYTNIAFGYNGTPQYFQWITSQHYGGQAANNAIGFWTSDGTQLGTFPTNAINGLWIENGKIIIGGPAVSATAMPSPRATLDVRGNVTCSAVTASDGYEGQNVCREVYTSFAEATTAGAATTKTFTETAGSNTAKVIAYYVKRSGDRTLILNYDSGYSGSGNGTIYFSTNAGGTTTNASITGAGVTNATLSLDISGFTNGTRYDVTIGLAQSGGSVNISKLVVQVLSTAS